MDASLIQQCWSSSRQYIRLRVLILWLTSIKGQNKSSFVQSLSCVQLFKMPWTATRQASLCPSQNKSYSFSNTQLPYLCDKEVH